MSTVLDTAVAISNVVSAVVAFGTLVVARSALSGWKKQNESQLAGEIIGASLCAQEIISGVRSWGLMKCDKSELNDDPNLIPLNKLHKQWYQVVVLDGLRLKAKVHFKKLKIEADLNELIKIIMEIKNAAENLVQMAQAGVVDGEPVLRCKEIVWSPIENDRIEPRVVQIVETIQKKLGSRL